MAPEIQVLIPEYGQKGLHKYDLVKDLEMRGDYLPWIIWMGLNCNHKYPYKEEKRRLDFRRQYDGGSRGWYKKNMEEGPQTKEFRQAATRSCKRPGNGFLP